MIFLFENIIKQKESDFKIQAAIHGIDLSKNVENQEEGYTEPKQSTPQQPANQTLPLFRDPDDYAHMSQEERQALTEKMKKQHENWAKKGKIVKG